MIEKMSYERMNDQKKQLTEMNRKRSPSNLFQTSHDHSIFLNRINNSIHNSSRMYFEMNISTNLELQTEPQRGTFYALGLQM